MKNRLNRTLAACLALGAPLTIGCVSPSDMRETRSPELRGVSFDEAGYRVPSIETLESLAHVLAVQGNDVQGEVVLHRLIDHYPAYTPAYNELAELHLRKDEPESALKALEAGLRVSPEDLVLLNNVGMFHILGGDHAAAIAAFDRALAKHPDDVRTLANKALATGLGGDEGEALALYMEALSLWEAHYNLGVICESRGEEAKAERYFRLADELKGYSKLDRERYAEELRTAP